MRKEISCGAVILARGGDEPRYVVIESVQGVYGFPKGHMEGAETETETALREIREEVGLTVTLLPGWRAEDAYPLPKRPEVTKRVIYFPAVYDETQPLRPQPAEVRTAALLTLPEALERLTFEGAQRILREADGFFRAQGLIP